MNHWRELMTVDLLTIVGLKLATELQPFLQNSLIIVLIAYNGLMIYKAVKKDSQNKN